MPESRRDAYIKAAEALFAEKGFENTSVEDIVRRAGTAKGLFYYYFDSKEELMTALTERILEEIKAHNDQALSEEGMSAMQRLERIVSSTDEIRARSRMLAAFFHQERNQALHYAFDEKARAIMAPALESIIRQGNAEGVFRADYPKETAQCLLAGIGAVKHGIKCDSDREALVRALTVLQYLTERLLGAEPGTFTVYIDSLPPETRGKIGQ